MWQKGVDWLEHIAFYELELSISNILQLIRTHRFWRIETRRFEQIVKGDIWLKKHIGSDGLEYIGSGRSEGPGCLSARMAQTSFPVCWSDSGGGGGG
jgi:hypothetical protein